MPDILYEDDSILVVRKPAGQESQRGRGLSLDLESELKNYIARTTRRPEPYLAVVHRLDRPVAGVMVYAKTKNAAAVLSRSFSTGNSRKEYEALTDGIPARAEGTLENWVLPYRAGNLSKVLTGDEAAGIPASRKALLRYRSVELSACEAFSIAPDPAGSGGIRLLLAGKPFGRVEESRISRIGAVRITLLTGRHHQIRAQLAAAGFPVLGDAKYGNPCDEIQVSRGTIALAAVRLSFRHPVHGRMMTFCWDGRMTDG